MKKYSFYTVVLVLIALVLSFTPYASHGQLLLNEDFTGLTTSANLATQNSWTKDGSGPDVTVQNSSSITYTGYNGGGGNYVQIPSPSGTTSRVYKGFTSTTAIGNTFFVSFLLNLSAVTSSGNYFISLGDPNTGTTYGPRLFAKESGAGFVLGVSKSTNTVNYGSTVYNLNTTYLIVMRFNGVTGSSNDLAYVWVNPSLASEPNTSLAECSDVSGTDPGYSGGNIGNFHWHNRSANNPTGKFDGVRVSAGSTSASAWSSLDALSSNVPSAPSITSINSGNTQLTVNFTAPVSDGGSAITNYKYSTDNGSTYTACSPTQTTSPIVITGLTNGTSYDVKIRAINSNGDGTESTKNTATPYTTAGAPTINSITPGATTLSVAFTAPVSNGGSTITNYKYSTDNGSTYTAFSPVQTTSPLTIEGLTPNTSYDVKLIAINAAGDGAASSATNTTTLNQPVISISNVSANPIDFGTIVLGNLTAEDSYTISGTNLTEDITVTAPTNYEVSKTDVGPYSTSITYTPTSGTVSSSFVYVRYNPSVANGTNSANITHSSNYATTQNVAVTGIAVSAEPTTKSTITLGTISTTSIQLNFTGGNGTRRLLIAREGSAVNHTPTDATELPTGVNSVFTSATDKGSGNKYVYDGTGTTVTVTGLTKNTNYYFALYEYNIGTNNSANYLTSTFETKNTSTKDEAVYLTDNTGATLEENIDAIGTSSTAILPTGYQFTNTATSTPVYGTNVTTNTTKDYGTTGSGAVANNSAGGLINWANGITGSSTDRALGFLTTGSFAGPRSLMGMIKNTIGETITSLIFSYNIEKYRSGSREFNVKFYTSTDGSTWVLQNTTNYPADANNNSIYNPPLSTSVEVKVYNLSIAQNSNYYFRWEYEGVSGSSNAQGLGIDDVSITPFSNTSTIGNPNISGTINNLNVTNNTTLTANVTLNGKLYAEDNTKINLNGNSLTLNGEIIGTPKFTGSATSDITIASQGNTKNIEFDQTTPGTTNLIKNLTIDNNGDSVYIDNALQINTNGTITVSNATPLVSNGNITLVSTLSGTGRIAPLTSGAKVCGNVIVQRYMVGGDISQRGWRTVSTPVKSATYAQLIDDIFVTGPGGSSNGFDAAGSNSSIMTYEESASRGWKSISNINNSWNAGIGALVFFRGDRTQTTSITNSSIVPNNNTMDYAGEINSGDITVNLDFDNSGPIDDQGYNLVGNPYPSQIKWDNVSIDKGVSVDDYYYIINPNTKNYVSDNNSNIAIGQGFFVRTTAASQSITFKENNKSNNAHTSYFKTNALPFTIKMNLDSVQYDIAKIVFKTNASRNYVFKEDAMKLENPSYNIAFLTPNNKLVQNNVIDYFSNNGIDTFELNVTSTGNRNYTLNFSNLQDIPTLRSILLYDKFTSSITNIRNSSFYTFTINNGNSLTYGNRFLLIFTDQYNPLPIQLLSFNGYRAEKLNVLNWITANEKNINHFEIERSLDNKTFESIGLVKATNTASKSEYIFNDIDIPKEFNTIYYRLKVVENKTISYSQTIAVHFNNSISNSIDIYPNPVKTNFIITNFENATTIKLYDVWGVQQSLVTQNNQIDISTLPTGTYLLVITTNQGENLTKKIIKE